MVAARNTPDGEQTEARPRARRVRVVADALTRLRNDRWLKIQREFAFTVRALADFLSQPRATIAAGLAEARERETPATPAPESTLSADELAELIHRYGPDSAPTDDPETAAWKAKFAAMPEVGDFLSRHRSTPPAR